MHSTSTSTTFYAIFIGYLYLTLARRGFAVVSTTLLADESLGLTKVDVGVVVSVYTVCAGCGKFIGGVLSDAVAPRSIFIGGLLAAALSNAAVSLVDTPLFTVLFSGALRPATAIMIAWGVNGASQGFAWPAIAQLMLRRFSAANRGAVWGLITMAGNAAKVAAPILYTRIAMERGWRDVFRLSAVLALLGAALCWAFLAPAQAQGRGGATLIKPSDRASSAPKRALCVIARRPSLWAILVADVFVYVVLEALSSWIIPMTIAQHAVSKASGAALLSCYELGGVVGTLAAGYISDALGGVGKRNLTSWYGSLALVGALATLRALPVAADGEGARLGALGAALFVAGLGVYAPKTMAGIAVREAHPSAAGSAGALLGLVGQFGAALAGVPLVLAVKVQEGRGVGEWNAVFGALLFAAVAGALLFGGLHLAESARRADAVRADVAAPVAAEEEAADRRKKKKL